MKFKSGELSYLTHITPGFSSSSSSSSDEIMMARAFLVGAGATDDAVDETD